MLLALSQRSHASDPVLEEEAIKVIRYLEQGDIAVYAGRSIFDFWIRIDRVEEAFTMLDGVTSLDGSIEDYSEKMLELNKSEILLGQLETFEQNLLAYIDGRQVHSVKLKDHCESLNRIKQEVTCVYLLVAGEREKGLKQFDEMRARLLFEVEGLEQDAIARNPEGWEDGFEKTYYAEMKTKIEARIRNLKFYALQAIEKKEGAEQAKQLIERFGNEVPAENRTQETEWFAQKLEKHLQPPGKPFKLETYEEERRKEAQAEFDSIDKLDRPVEWAAKVIELKSRFLPKPRLELLDEVAQILADCEIENESVEELRWKMVPHYLERENWDKILMIMENHNPNRGDYLRYHEILYRVSRQIPDQLKSFVDLLPDSDERFSYNLRLVDNLLQLGYLEKAEANLGSVDFNAGIEEKMYLRKLRFYQALEKANYKDVDAIAGAYLENETEKQKDQETPEQSASNDFNYYYNAVLGDDHLAKIAIRSGPEVALDVARRVPDALSKYRRGSDVRRCMTALIRRNRPDLAVQVFNVATEQEQLEAKLRPEVNALFGEKSLSTLMTRKDWEFIETVIPGEWQVVNILMSDAAQRSDKERAFELVRRNWMTRADIPLRCFFLFGKQGWGKELLDLAEEIQALKKGNRRYDRLVENTVENLSDSFEFTSAEEAIAFAEKYLTSKQRKAEFLMTVVEKWSRE